MGPGETLRPAQVDFGGHGDSAAAGDLAQSDRQVKVLFKSGVHGVMEVR